MVDEAPVSPALVQALMPAIDSIAEMVDRHIEVALAPLQARIEELERQVAELTSRPDNSEDDTAST